MNRGREKLCQALQPAAARRLMRDLADLTQEPLEAVSAGPLGDDLTTWHGNLCALEGPLAGVAFHFGMRFPCDYPSSPPDVQLFTTIPHTNVFGNWICLDMLKDHMVAEPYAGWSSAYTVSSVLRQLQSFLFAERVDQMTYGGEEHALDNRISEESAWASSARAHTFECRHEACAHTGARPSPALPPATRGVRAQWLDDLRSARGRAAVAKHLRRGSQSRRGVDVDSASTSRERRRALRALEALTRGEERALGLSGSCGAEAAAVAAPAPAPHPRAAPSATVAACWPLNEDLTHLFMSYLADETLHALRRVPGPDGRFFGHVLQRFRVFERRELLCFHRKCSYRTDTLGVGLEVVWHGRSGQAREMRPRPDLLSHAAFYDDGVRLSVWKEPFTHFLPLYLCESHGARAWPRIEAALARLQQPARSGSFAPVPALDVLAKVMNGVVVRFMLDADRRDPDDRSTVASEKALVQFGQFHHLLLALAARYPVVAREADRRVRAFVRSPQGRHKRAVPDLGEFLVLLAVTSRASWDDVAVPLVSELFARQVMWVMRERRGFEASTLGVCPRLALHFEHSKTGLRLLAFQTFFLREVAGRPRLSPAAMLAEYNRRLGQPEPAMVQRLQRACRYIRGDGGMDWWMPFFDFCRLPRPAVPELFALLDEAVDQSARARYHRPASRGRHAVAPPTCAVCACGTRKACLYAVGGGEGQKTAPAGGSWQGKARRAARAAQAGPPARGLGASGRAEALLVPVPAGRREPVDVAVQVPGRGLCTPNPRLRAALFEVFVRHAGGREAALCAGAECGEWRAAAGDGFTLSREALGRYLATATRGAVRLNTADETRRVASAFADAASEAIGLAAGRAVSLNRGVTLREFMAFYAATAARPGGARLALSDLREFGYDASLRLAWSGGARRSVAVVAAAGTESAMLATPARRPAPAAAPTGGVRGAGRPAQGGARSLPGRRPPSGGVSVKASASSWRSRAGGAPAAPAPVSARSMRSSVPARLAGKAAGALPDVETSNPYEALGDAYDGAAGEPAAQAAVPAPAKTQARPAAAAPRGAPARAGAPREPAPVA